MNAFFSNAFFNAEHRLRNGWWMLIFVALIAATRTAKQRARTVSLSPQVFPEVARLPSAPESGGNPGRV